MKIITLQRRTLDGEPVEYSADENGEDHQDWWCVVETKEEELIYNRLFGGFYNDDKQRMTIKDLWNAMVNHAGEGMGLCRGEDDIYGYIMPDETCPLPTEPFIDGDNDEWVRVE